MSRTGHSSDLAGMGCDTGCYVGPRYFSLKGGSHPSLYHFIHFPTAYNKLITCTLAGMMMFKPCLTVVPSVILKTLFSNN